MVCEVKTSVAELLDASANRSNVCSSATNVLAHKQLTRHILQRVAASADEVFVAVQNITEKGGSLACGNESIAGRRGASQLKRHQHAPIPRSMKHSRPLPHPAKHTSTIRRETTRRIRRKGTEGRHRRKRSWTTEMMFGCET
eukprot:scaffold120623_cov38-Cyclotella_meneghiniana.AAC.1